jgi:hypothetical protein
MNYEVLNPWAEIEPIAPTGLLPRVTNLDGKTVGIFSYFKPWGPVIMKEIEKQLQERFPKTKFSYFYFYMHMVEIAKDKENKEAFEEWLQGVDTVVTGHGD